MPYSGPQTIEGTVAIDFRQMDGWESIIKNAKEIQFSFELKQKQDTKEYIKLDAPSSHIAGLEVGVLNHQLKNIIIVQFMKTGVGFRKIIQALRICRKVYSVFRLDGR